MEVCEVTRPIGDMPTDDQIACWKELNWISEFIQAQDVRARFDNEWWHTRALFSQAYALLMGTGFESDSDLDEIFSEAYYSGQKAGVRQVALLLAIEPRVLETLYRSIDNDEPDAGMLTAERVAILRGIGPGAKREEIFEALGIDEETGRFK